MDDNHLLHYQSITIQEAEHHTYHSQETDITIDPTAEITDTVKDLEITIVVTTREVQAILETILVEAEITVITEIIIIIIIVLDLTPDIEIEVTQDEIPHIIEIIITITLIITTGNDNIEDIQLELTDTENNQIAIIDTNQTITAKITDEIHETKRKTIDIIQETEIIIEPTTIIRIK